MKHSGEHEAPGRSGSPILRPWDAEPGEVVDLNSVRRVRATRHHPDFEDSTDSDGVLVGEVVPVDPPATVPGSFLGQVAAAERRALVPSWLLSRGEFAQVVRWVAGYYTHVAAYHTLRVPKYAGRLAVRSPRGAWRVLAGSWRWVFDLEGRPVRLAVAERTDAEAYLRLAKLRDERVKTRLLVAVLVAVFGVAVTAVVLVVAPAVWQWLALSCVVAVLGAAGTPADRPVVDSPAVTRFQAPRLTSESVLAALGALQVTLINQAVGKGWGREAFPDPIMRDGPGWRAHVDLPLGVTATDIMERRDKLASGLRRPVGCVWPEPDNAQHPGRLVLWVGDQDMSKARQPEWPLLKSGAADLFRPQPFGTDQRGRWVPLTLMFTSVVIGAIPRMGKTFALRELLLIAALDPRAELHAYDLKGTGDLSPVDAVAHRYRAGDEDDDIAYAIADMRALQEELRRRAKVIRELPRDVCPENKVTPELAGKRTLGLHPVVIGVDECQVWFEHPEHGKEFEAICTDLVKRGPALGIVMILATQRPDAKSLPTGISANAGTRYCLKVMGHTENDMVLGTSSHKNGIKATMFTWTDKGIGYLVGSGEDARITRSVYIDAPTAEKIGLRARAARITAGLLTGHAAGQDLTPDDAGPGHNLLEDLAAVWPGEQDKAWSETLVTRLAELRPDVYTGWTPKVLASALEPHGIGTVQVWGATDDGRNANRKGVTRTHLTDALNRRAS